MDDRIYDEFGSRRRPQTGSDTQKRNSKAGDFKVSIDFDAVEAREARQAGRSAYTSQQNFSAARKNSSDSNFKVSLPEQNTAKASSAQQRRTTSQAQQPTPTPRKRTESAPVSKKRSELSSASKTAQQKNTKALSNSAAPNKSEAKSASSQKKKQTPAKSPKSKEKQKLDRTKTSLVVCACLIFIAVVTIILSTVALETVNDILAINKDKSETVSVEIPENAGFDEVYDILADNGLVKQKLVVKLFCKFRNYDRYYSEKQEKYIDVQYEPGVYYFETSDGIETMLEQIKVSSTVSKDTVRITFPEGWTIAQIFEKIEKYNVCTAEKLYANLDIVGEQFEFYENIKSNSGRYLKAEGYLFPDTYDFYIGESASSVLKKLFNNFNSKWTEEYDEQAKKLGMTQDEIIILASIIEAEAKGESQMKGVSSVLHNRLENSATYPLLQMNSTKDYITEMKEYEVFTDFYYSIYLDSYNTYSVEGLPAGAICNPGAAAIEAALYPADTDYNFFCHDSSGNIYYAVTAAEHQKNAEKILYQ